MTGSIIYPYVSLRKTESGFCINVGIIPFSKIGIWYSAYILPIVPFYAFLETNLSPSAGYLDNYVYKILSYSDYVLFKDDIYVYFVI